MIRRCVAIVGLIVCVAVLEAKERNVIVPVDETPFEVGMKDVVRISAKGIAGSKFSVAVDGPAKIVNENVVIQRKGKGNLLGQRVKEYEIAGSDKGMVTVTVTVTPPQPGAAEIVKKYQYEVK